MQGSLLRWLSAAIVLLTAAACTHPAWVLRFTGPLVEEDLFYTQAMFCFCVLSAGTFASVLCWAYSGARSLPALSGRRAVALLLAGICVFFFAFIVHVGRHQFGGYDFNDVLEIGWRQVRGQRPYADFLASTPPGFNLGLKLTNAVFGLSWDAVLYLTSAFTCATFLWLYWLFRRLSLAPGAAMLSAFAVESSAMLTLCFWWYNNLTLILATVLFLSTLLLVRSDEGEGWTLPEQASWVASLILLSWTKPSIAGLTILACVGFLACFSRHRLRTLALTAGAAVGSVLLLLAARVPIPALWRTYMAVAGERGFGSIGYSQLTDLEQTMAWVWIPVYSLPFLALLPGAWRLARQGQIRAAATRLFYLLAVVVAIYGVATNGEILQVEWTLMLAGGGAIAFGLESRQLWLRRVYLALLLMAVASNLYFGWSRLRIHSVGLHTYFEWQDNENLIAEGPLRHMRVSRTMIELEQQVRAALDQNPGPYFFGPRIDFNHAVLGVPSREGLPAWWHPGTAFDRRRQPELEARWESYHFQTLIFLKDDYTYYSDAFKQRILAEYAPDNRFSRVTVFHRK